MPLLKQHPSPHWRGSGCKAVGGTSVPSECPGPLEPQQQVNKTMPCPRLLAPGMQGHLTDTRVTAQKKRQILNSTIHYTDGKSIWGKDPREAAHCPSGCSYKEPSFLKMPDRHNSYGKMSNGRPRSQGISFCLLSLAIPNLPAHISHLRQFCRAGFRI